MVTLTKVNGIKENHTESADTHGNKDNPIVGIILMDSNMARAHFIILIILCSRDSGNKAKEMDLANLLTRGD